MTLNDADRKKLQAMLGQLGGAVEDLLRTGLTTASETTRQTLNVVFQEASRLKLLQARLDPAAWPTRSWDALHATIPISRGSRFCFFLGRAWLLSKGLLAP